MLKSVNSCLKVKKHKLENLYSFKQTPFFGCFKTKTITKRVIL